MDFALPELESLLSPIDGGAPIGTRPPDDDFSSPCVQLGQLCRSALRLEKDDSQGKRDEATRVWVQVAEKGVEILSRRWKNLDVAAQLIQGLARTNGAAGIDWGYRLVAGLVERFWDSLSAEWAGDFDRGLQALNGLNEAVVTPLRRHQIADSRRDGPVFFYQFAAAQKLEEATPEERTSLVARGALAMGDLLQRVAQTPDDYYRQLLADLSAARQSIQTTDNVLTAKLREVDQTHAVPATSAILELLEDVDRTVSSLVKDRLTVAVADDSSATPDHAAAPTERASPGKLGSRVDALRQLEQLAAVLEGLERQSLVPLVIRYGVWLGHLGQREFFQYFKEKGDQLLQLLEPILEKTTVEEHSSE